MAKNGTYSVEATPYDDLIFSWSVSSQSVTGNYSDIAWSFKLVAGSYGRLDSDAGKSLKIYLNGSTLYSGTVTVGINNNTTRTLASGTKRIYHNEDGTAGINVTVKLEWGISFTLDGTGYYASNYEIKGSGTIDQIYRKSTLSGSNGTLGTAQTLTINRQSSSFTHKISYECGSASGYALGSASATGSGTSISWTPPLSLASQNTTGTSVTVDFVLGTYSGSTLIGYDYLTLTYSIPASVKPSVSLKLTDITGIDKIYGSPVQGLSKINIVATATQSYGAYIETYSITANGSKYTDSEVTTGALKDSGNSPVSVTVKDSRGRTGSASYTMKVKAYTRPNVSALDVYRCDADGTENDQGEYIRVVFSAAVTDIDSLGKNAAAYKLRYKQTTDADYTEIDFTALAGQYAVNNHAYIFAADSSSSYDVEIVVEDSHVTTTRSTSASTAFTLMNWGANGTSLGIGKVAERSNALEVALDLYNSGSLVQTGNRYCMSTPGETDVSGYILMARISIISANADTPITFVFSQRQAMTPMTVHVRLKNSTMDTSELTSIRYEGTNYGAFLVKTGALIWDLYVEKSSSWDTITLQDWYSSKTMESRVAITFPGTMVGALPGEWYRATPAALDSLRDYIYPVGSVYISYSHVSPADLFGGTWERIENAFLWGVDSSGTIGQTGGEKTHTLTTAELPAHSHGSVYSGNASGSKSYAWLSSGGSSMAYGAVSAGSGQAHNNMPPYVQVSIWRRTA